MRNYELRIVGLSLLVSCFLSIGAGAQLRKPYVLPTLPKDTSMFWIFKDVTAGPYFTGGVSRQNEDLPVAWNSSPRFAFAFGGTIDFFYSQWFGIDFTALYDSRDLYVDTAGESMDLSLGYLAFEPAIRIFWLLIGIAFDIPMSGSATENLAAYSHSNQPNTHSYSENLNVQTSDIQPLTELRATLSIPILQGDDAYLHLVISGSYPLTKTIRGTSSFDTTGYSPAGNTTGRFSGPNAPGQGPLPTIEAGISYDFDLLH
jgi:hypothetical protein